MNEAECVNESNPFSDFECITLHRLEE
jgi:hypothetical protein